MVLHFYKSWWHRCPIITDHKGPLHWGNSSFLSYSCPRIMKLCASLSFPLLHFSLTFITVLATLHNNYAFTLLLCLLNCACLESSTMSYTYNSGVSSQLSRHSISDECFRRHSFPFLFRKLPTWKARFSAVIAVKAINITSTMQHYYNFCLPLIPNSSVCYISKERDRYFYHQNNRS